MTRRFLLALAPAALAAQNAEIVPNVEWAPVANGDRFGLAVRLHANCPETEAWAVTIRYRLAGETTVREHRRTIARTEDGFTTDFVVATSGPAHIVAARLRELAIGPGGEQTLEW